MSRGPVIIARVGDFGGDAGEACGLFEAHADGVYRRIEDWPVVNRARALAQLLDITAVRGASVVRPKLVQHVLRYASSRQVAPEIASNDFARATIDDLRARIYPAREQSLIVLFHDGVGGYFVDRSELLEAAAEMEKDRRKR